MTTDVTRFPFWKKLLFSFIPATLLLVIVILLEGAARLLFPSSNNPFLTTVTIEGTHWQQINRRYLKKYFPATIAVLPEFKPTLIRTEKTDTTFRVVCLGGSSMFGTPYQMTANIPGIVRKQLRHLSPSTDFEVINLGASAINSNVVRDLADNIADLQPDLVLVYMGHNEFYGPDGVGAPSLEKSHPWITRVKYGLRNFTLVRVFTSLLSSEQEAEASVDRTLMREVSRNSLVREGSDDALRVQAIFQDNLGEIIRFLKDRQTPVILSDIVSNLHFPPFVSDSTLSDGRPLPTEFIQEMRQRGTFRRLADSLARFIKTDSTNALLRYWHGEALFSLDKPSEASFELQRARDLDLLKFRAPGSLNRVIHSAASSMDVPIISADSLFASQSPGGIPGNNLFWEHLHPTAFGYYQIATLFVQKALELGIIPRVTNETMLPFDRDSLSLAWLDLAYADLSIQHLTTRWPFRGYKVSSAVIQTASPGLMKVARDVYMLSTGWNEGCLTSAEYFALNGQVGEASTTYEALLDEYPYDIAVRYKLANLYKDNGLYESASTHYEQILKLRPRHLSSFVELGLVEINRGNFSHAIELLSQAWDAAGAEGNTMKATIQYGLAGAKANSGDIRSALSHLDQALQLNPGYPAASALRSSLLEHQTRHPVQQ